MSEQEATVRECEDCEEEMPTGRRRIRCPRCKQLVCRWCWHHVHALSVALHGTTVADECGVPK